MFSPLQVNILKEVYENRGRVSRRIFLSLFRNKKIKTPVKIITQSLERLINRGLVIGYCTLKSGKCFIYDVKITSAGKRAYESWWKIRQKKLPF
jgi:predicted MarR family transcription regulator